ncbi:QueE [Haloarcula californiae tailed virus 1]|uniref:QueE n=1 Tax=Haloarcula californiae tailed virus 1 TaxID=1273746 RepID=R4TAH8_9CAUD|nr:QueE-like radical SAM domain [Haloarcula californiae tailed virus 1]AGM11930.1 QueE [Haloarcula californiae tailed virus 1]
MKDESTQIPVAEHFFSIQGEGPNAGTPAVFLRLAGCNLACGGNENMQVEKQEDMEPRGDATWVCDSIEVWRNPDYTYTPAELIDEWEDEGWWQKMTPEGAHLILTGGEPMLEQRQDQIVGLIAEMLRRRKRGKPFIEVETNGTIVPEDRLDNYINLYNVSLKLSNSGMPEDARLKDDALDFHANNDTSIFKFVVSREQDVSEVLEIVEAYNIPDDRISLMPAGQTREQLAETYPIVAELCKERTWDFTPRLQVTTWDEATGV